MAFDVLLMQGSRTPSAMIKKKFQDNKLFFSESMNPLKKLLLALYFQDPL